MAEMLSHVLLAFALFTVVGWAVDWFDREWVAIGMVGSILPDLNRLGLVLDGYTVGQLLGIPFDWDGLHTLGGLVVLAAIGAVLFPSWRERRRAFGVLVAGGLSHLVVDAVKAWADGANGAYLYPLSWWRNPTPSLYVSADRWVLVIAATLALVALFVDRYVVE